MAKKKAIKEKNVIVENGEVNGFVFGTGCSTTRVWERAFDPKFECRSCPKLQLRSYPLSAKDMDAFENRLRTEPGFFEDYMTTYYSREAEEKEDHEVEAARPTKKIK